MGFKIGDRVRANGRRGTTGPYETLGTEIGKLVEEKQKAYGDAFGRLGDILRILYPDGIRPEQYDDALAITRIGDKLFRIANKKEAFGESPYRDIAGYGLLGAVKDEGTNRSRPSEEPAAGCMADFYCDECEALDEDGCHCWTCDGMGRADE